MFSSSKRLPLSRLHGSKSRIQLTCSVEQLPQGKLADLRVEMGEVDGEIGVLASALKENLAPRQAELQEALESDEAEAAG